MSESSITNQNNFWRPSQTIRTKVIGIIKNDNKLLVCEVLNDHGERKGWCPPRGGVDFCETCEQALKREIGEVLGCSITISQGPFICENIFEHHGFKGHEIVLIYHIHLDDQEIYNKQRFQIFESRGSKHWMEWINIEDFYSRKEILFPPFLLSN